MFRIIVVYPACRVSIRARTTPGTPALSGSDVAMYSVMILLPNGMCSDW